MVFGLAICEPGMTYWFRCPNMNRFLLYVTAREITSSDAPSAYTSIGSSSCTESIVRRKKLK
jgi:hypothetical protein